MSDRPLNPQQLAFCAYYAADPEHNGKRAAIEAGYAAASAEVTASKLLRLAKVKAEVDRRLNKKLAAIDFDGADVLRELGEMAFYELTHPTKDDETGEMKWPLIRASDKAKALELLGKHFKLFTDKVEHSGRLTLEQLVAEAGQEPEG